MGDIVGYGANPKECLELVRSTRPVWVAGNHDKGACGQLDLSWFNSAARAAVTWTASVLSEAERSCLAQIPLENKIGPWSLVHGGPGKPEEFEYCFDTEDAAQSVKQSQTSLLAVGHTHIPMAASFDTEGKVRLYREPIAQLNTAHKHLINPGSVGRMFDGDPRASFAILKISSEKIAVEHFRIPYAVEAVIADLKNQKLPDI